MLEGIRKGIGTRKVLPGFAAGTLFSQLSRGNIRVSRSGGDAFTAPPTPFRIGSSQRVSALCAGPVV